MILEYVGTKLLPHGWEMWTTGTKWQAVATWAREENKESYTPICKTRGDALRVVKKMRKSNRR